MEWSSVSTEFPLSVGKIDVDVKIKSHMSNISIAKLYKNYKCQYQNLKKCQR